MPQFGVERATVVNSSLCESAGRARSSVAFTFAHQETGRHMHGALATGAVREPLACSWKLSSPWFACSNLSSMDTRRAGHDARALRA